MNNEVLSRDEIIAWLKRKFGNGPVTVPGKHHGRELPSRGFCRAVGLDDGGLSRIINAKGGGDPLKTRMRVISRFIRDWENGLLEFSEGHVPGKAGMVRRELRHLAEPRKMPVRFTVELVPHARLRMASKPAPMYRFPEFRSIIPIDKKP